MDNAHGAGSGYRDESGAPVFWYSHDCPIHADAEPVPMDERLTQDS
jgi:hypothetical protein